LHQYLNRLKERVNLLGNHHQKYIRTIEKHLDPLVECLENAGKLEDIHLWKGSPRLIEEMDVILNVAPTYEQKLTFLACYYSLQILHLNLRSIDVLRLNLTGSGTEERLPIYKHFMLQTGSEFRKLSGSYMQKLLDLFSNSKPYPEFTILGVGSLAHQDDIDIGIIDDGSAKRKELNVTINRLRKEMFKSATELHFYLSEHVGSQFYTASIQEYKKLLDNEIHDFIIISELLNAVPILGSIKLFSKFNLEITHRYHYQKNRDNKYHEGYLRGILGEVRSFLFRKIDENKLSPKDDALRMVSGIIFSGKTIFRIFRGNRWDILSVLARKDSARQQLYSNLEKSLTFLEIFRHVYQLFVGLEEEVYLDDPIIVKNMQTVAISLGYHDMGAISAWDHLLIHYHEYVELARNTAARLLEDVTEHVKLVSSFSNMTKLASEPDPYRTYPGNMAVDFLRISRFYKGTKFWDDILETLKSEDNNVLQNFVNDFKQSKPRLQKVLIEKYGTASQLALYPMISFLVILSKNKHKLGSEKLCHSLNNEFFLNLMLTKNRVLRLSKVFSRHPTLINDYITTLADDQQKQFASLLIEDLWEEEQQKYKKLLAGLCEIHCNTSHYFKRFFTRIVSQHPNYIQYLEDTASLAQISKGMLGTIDSLTRYEDQKKQLNDYHDLEFLRIGLEALQGVPIDQIDVEFTEFSDNYLQILFDICKQKINKEIGGPISTKDLIAIYVSGGHAREQAFDDDWDIIVLLNENDPVIRDYCDRIVAMMNTEIIKRGIMPHYRFTDHFGHYVTLVDDLDEFFSKEEPDVYIDKSQILGARMIVGSTKFQEKFEERIIKPHIYEKCSLYVGQMIKEMESRHHDKRNIRAKNINVKEGIGGLRDIEILLLIYKAKYQLKEPLNRKLFNTICEKDSKHRAKFVVLKKHFDFLKQLRDLYRLTVSADDVIKTNYLSLVAKIMGYKPDEQRSATENMIQEFNRSTEQINQIVQHFIEEIKCC